MSYGPWQSDTGGYRAKMSELKPTLAGDFVAAPGGKLCLKDFKERRAADGNILYWQFARVGPGVRTTTYTIWNE